LGNQKLPGRTPGKNSPSPVHNAKKNRNSNFNMEKLERKKKRGYLCLLGGAKGPQEKKKKEVKAIRPGGSFPGQPFKLERTARKIATNPYISAAKKGPFEKKIT